MKKVNDDVVDRISDYMKEKCLKQKILSKATGLKDYTITAILNKRRKLCVDEYIEIIEALDLPFEYFIQDKKEDSAIPPRTSESSQTEIWLCNHTPFSLYQKGY